MQDLALEQVGHSGEAVYRWGRKSSPPPARNSPGPTWSKKMKGPTICRSCAGRARRTSKPPKSWARGKSTISTPSGGGGQRGLSAGCQLISFSPKSCGVVTALIARELNLKSEIGLGGSSRWGHPSLKVD